MAPDDDDDDDNDGDGGDEDVDVDVYDDIPTPQGQEWHLGQNYRVLPALTN